MWEGERPNQFRGLHCEAAIDLLLAFNVAGMLRDLSPLRNVGLHKLTMPRMSLRAPSGLLTSSSGFPFLLPQNLAHGTADDLWQVGTKAFEVLL